MRGFLWGYNEEPPLFCGLGSVLQTIYGIQWVFWGGHWCGLWSSPQESTSSRSRWKWDCSSRYSPRVSVSSHDRKAKCFSEWWDAAVSYFPLGHAMFAKEACAFLCWAEVLEVEPEVEAFMCLFSWWQRVWEPLSTACWAQTGEFREIKLNILLG